MFKLWANAPTDNEMKIYKLSPKEIQNLPCVLVRSDRSGVHFGYLADEQFTPAGKVVTLLNTRRIWQWVGAASISQIADSGVTKPEECKFSVLIPQNEIVGVIETIPISKQAKDQLYKIPVWVIK
jgi:hypothetical protein